MKKKLITECYERWEGSDRSFDRQFWSLQKEEMIFQAAADLICDYWLIRTGHAHEPRLQRTVENFQRI